VDHIPIFRMGGFLLVTVQVDVHDRLRDRRRRALRGEVVERRVGPDVRWTGEARGARGAAVAGAADQEEDAAGE
jgi:hypothetical protein